jgi:hypothetical protein
MWFRDYKCIAHSSGGLEVQDQATGTFDVWLRLLSAYSVFMNRLKILLIVSDRNHRKIKCSLLIVIEPGVLVAISVLVALIPEYQGLPLSECL